MARVATTDRGIAGDHRCTPPSMWRAALAAIGRDEFDLDPATNDFATVPAHRRCTGQPFDGLAYAWHGDVWVNPPFSNLQPWVDRFRTCNARSIQFCGPADLSTRWAQMMMRSCDAWAAWPRREHFPTARQPRGQPLAGMCIWYRGPTAERWVAHMRSVGCVAYFGHP